MAARSPARLQARAQQPRLPTIGYLGATASSASEERPRLAVVAQRLEELGWIEGRTVGIEYRWAGGHSERFTDFAAEFARLKADLIVTYSTAAVIAVKQITSAIPIVFAGVADPVGTGIVASLARPGGNATGVSLRANARLRAAPGDPLFVRSQHGIVPTRRASALAAPLKQLIADAKVIAMSDRFDPATASQTFAVSLNDYMQLTILLPLVADLRREAPGIRLSVRPLVVDDLVADLARGEIDLVVTTPEFAMSDLPSRLLYRETYVGVVRSEHPLAGGPVSIEDFCRFEHVLVSPTRGSFEGPTDDACGGRVGAGEPPIPCRASFCCRRCCRRIT